MNIATTNAIAKVAAVLAGLGLVFSTVMISPAKADTVSDLQAQIAALLAQVQTLQAQLGAAGGSTGGGYTFTMDLTMGSSGAEVTALQNFLIGAGQSIPAGATGYFGTQTQAALAAWQAANGIAPAAGYFGPITRAKVNSMGGGTSGGGTSGGSGGFLGGDEEGYLDEFDQLGTYSTEEVGEDEEDVGVLGVEFEAKDADQMVERVTVVIDTPTGNDDLSDFISDVSLWLNGEEVGRKDVGDCGYVRSTDTYTCRFTGMDGVAEEDEVSELVVAVTAVGNVDSDDEGKGWTANIPVDGIRAVSPNGVDDTYDTTEYDEIWTVESFASAADLEMKTRLGDDNPDEGIITIDNEGDMITLLQFEVEADGSDLTINDIPVSVAADNVTDLDSLIDELILEVEGGDEHSENVSTAAASGKVITFDDLDLDIDDGDTVVFTVSAVSATSSLYSPQDIGLTASVTPDNIDADDASGEEVADGDSSGSANGETQHLFTIVPEIEIVSTSIDPKDNGDAPAEAADAQVKVKVTARGGTLYLNGDNESTENKRFFVGQVYGSGTSASTTASSTVYTLSGTYTTTNSGADNEYYTLNEDDSVTITVDTIVSQSTVTTTTVLAGLRALLFQYGTDSTSDTTRSAIDLDWTDLTDETQTGTTGLVNAS